jgi:hypothetical protein
MPENSWEHLQSVLQNVHNRRVREEFSDVGDDSDDISTPRASLRTACKITDDDSAIIALMRMMLFYMPLRKASDMHPPLYTMPVSTYQESIKFAPQVVLYFKEDLSDVETGYAPIEAEISFRLVDETSTTYTEAKARVLANKIKAEFALGGTGYRWKKGRVKLSYRKPEDGYQMLINAFSEAEGKEVLNKVLDLHGHTIDGDKLSISQMESLPPIVPPTQMIYGKARRLPRKRPVGHVRFVYADLHIHGISNAITLIDLSRRRSKPLIKAD